jgi:hypothetical protein
LSRLHRTQQEADFALLEVSGTSSSFCAAIAWENYRRRFNHAFGIESQGFTEGAFCALPERGEAVMGSHAGGQQQA